ncbi:hypothetical protein CLAFUW4_06278 [Fulvia fulva]|nr:hypothetical protein CLAFUR4_06281 [Fulvia fulva]KAK4625594.1 hypothetical protein CLAFUR0_06285 [Fulvia fulva]WPV14544.1 hypothetical protein CLAFUW4_06278 [Fulvia fulva]
MSWLRQLCLPIRARNPLVHQKDTGACSDDGASLPPPRACRVPASQRQSTRPGTDLTSPKKKTHILDLPMELLELVVEAADVHLDVLNIRLTCKAFQAAASRAFNREYIESLTCFILNPSRLLRIKNMTSTPHLAEHIRSLRLTFASFEGRRAGEVSIAPYKDETIEEAQAVYTYGRLQEDVKHHKGVCARTQSINLDLIESILENLEKTPQAFRLWLDCGDTLVDGIQHHSLTLPASCLRLVQQHRLPLTTLALTDRCEVSLDALDYHPAATSDFAARFFHYDSDVKTLEDITSPKALEHLTAVQAIIAKARPVGLEISLSAQLSLWREKALMDLPTMLMPSSATGTLKYISLRHLHITLEHILGILTSCSGTLIHIDIDNVVVLHDQNPWVYIWRKLNAFSALEMVSFERLWPARSSEDLDDMESFIISRQQGGGDDIWSDRYSTSTKGLFDANDFLQWNVPTDGMEHW